MQPLRERLQAIRDSIRVIGSKTYIRFHERDADGDDEHRAQRQA